LVTVFHVLCYYPNLRLFTTHLFCAPTAFIASIVSFAIPS
jgi:hypothetical protein